MNSVCPPSDSFRNEATPSTSFTSGMKSSFFRPNTCIAISQAYILIPNALAASTSSSSVATLFYFIR